MVYETIFDPVTKVWSAPKEAVLFNPNQSVGNVILNILRQRPEDVTQVCADTGVHVTCKQMHDRTVRMALNLMKNGLKDTDFVGFFGMNTEHLAPAVFACFLIGIPVIPLSPLMTEKDIVHYYAQTIPKIIFCDKINLEKVKSAVSLLKKDIKIYTIMEKAEGYDCVGEILSNADYGKVNTFIPKIIDANKLAAILCSSGPTEVAKKVPKTHHQIISHYYSATADPLLGHNVKCLLMSPFFWITGFDMLIYTTLRQATRYITTQPLNSNVVVDVIQKYQLTNIQLPPFVALGIAEMKDLKPMECLRELTLSGEKISNAVGERLKKVFPNAEICNAYGMTEYSVVSINFSDDYECSGWLFKNYSVKIIDDNGNNLAHGESGEICVKNDVLFSYYYDDPETTAAKIKNDWFLTGDIGRFDDQNKIYIEGRKTVTMHYEGYYIIPEKLERILNQIDGVNESCIVGVVDNLSRNWIIHAFVIVDENKGLTEAQIHKQYNSKVMDQHMIRGGIHFEKQFPKDSSGKVDRTKLHKMAEKIDSS